MRGRNKHRRTQVLSTITIKNRLYGIDRKMDAMTQFNVSRRIAPVLATMGVSISALRSGNVAIEDFAPMLGPITNMIAAMDDETVEYIIAKCLAGVRVQQGDNWAPVVAAGSSRLMFEDIDMPALIRLVVEVLRVNLGDFLTELADVPQSTNS